MRTPAVVLLLCLGTPATADRPAPPPSSRKVAIANTFAFDWLDPKRSKCAKVTGALLRKLERSYRCEDAKIGSASGRTIVGVCTATGTRRSEYLLLASLADCREEREIQLSNGSDG